MRGNQRKNDASRACDTLLDSLNVLHEVNQRKLSEELFGACAVVVNDGLLSTLPSDVLSEIMQECRTNVGLIRDRKRLIWGNFDDVMGTKIALKEALMVQRETPVENSSPVVDEGRALRGRKRSSHCETSPCKRVRSQPDSKTPAKKKDTVIISTPLRSSRRSKQVISYAAMAAGKGVTSVKKESASSTKSEQAEVKKKELESRADSAASAQEEMPVAGNNSPERSKDETVEAEAVPLSACDTEGSLQDPEGNDAAEIMDNRQKETDDEAEDDKEDFECGEKVKTEDTVQEETEQEVKLQADASAIKSDPLTCEHCGFRSASRGSLRAHVQNRHGQKNLQCDICFSKFSYTYQLNIHRQNHFLPDGSLSAVAVAMCRSNMQKNGIQEEELSPEVAALLLAHDQKTLESTAAEDAKHVPGDESLPAIKSSVKGKVKKFGEFECRVCGVILTSEKLLQVHTQRQHLESKTTQVKSQPCTEENRLQCPHCDFVTYRTQTFSRHVSTHDKPAHFKCELCSYTNAAKSEVRRHMRNAHAEKTLGCPHCETKFRNRILLNQHIKQKHIKAYQTICELCGKEMTSTAYKEHFRRFHGPDAKVLRQTYICDKCGRKCRSKDSYDSHMAAFHSQEPNAEEEEISRVLAVGKSGSASCKLCGFNSKYAKVVVSHIIKVHAERRHACNLCGATFPRENLLEKHVNIFHRKLERCHCSTCGRAFHSQKHLKGHMQRMHMPEKQCHCAVCGKGFFMQQALCQHMELHKPEEEREYPFACEVCGKKFRFKSALARHTLEHSGERPFSCSQCQKSFATLTSLDQHMFVHAEERPYVCGVCQKAFKMKKYLDVHLLSHSTESVACQHCGRMFLKREALQRHICRCVVITNGGQLQPRLPTQPPEGSVFVCTKCGELFEDAAGVPQHVCQASGANIEEEASDKYICVACGNQFNQKKDADSHDCQLAFFTEDSQIAHEDTVVLEQASEEVESHVDNLVANSVIQGHLEVIGEGQEIKSEPGVESGLGGMCVDPGFVDSAELVPSDQTISAEPSEIFVCGVCRQVFSSPDEINLHLMEHEQDTTAVAPVSDGIGPEIIEEVVQGVVNSQNGEEIVVEMAASTTEEHPMLLTYSDG